MSMPTPAESPRATVARFLADYYGELAASREKPAPRFSVANVLRQMGQPDGGLDSGHEREVCVAAATVEGREFDRSRVTLPWAALAQRDMLTTNSAGFLVGDKLTAAADILRPFSVTASAGVTFFENLTENVQIPRVTTAPSGAWLSVEGTSQAGESQPTVARVTLTPKSHAVYLEFSAQFLRQASAAEAFIRAQLLRAAARAIDAAVLNGSGTSGEPMGLLNASDVPTEAGGTFSWPKACNMLETLANAGLDDRSAAWVASPDVRELLQQREVVSTAGRFVWDADRIANRPAYCTSDMPTATAIVGDWSRVVVGLWGAGLRVEINPYQDFSRGTIAARIIVSTDVAAVQPGAFVKSTAIS